MALRQISREAGAVRLCDLDPASGMLTIECRLCNRHGRYRLEALIEAYGPQAGRLLRPDTVEAGEQGGESLCGPLGGKGLDQGESAKRQHAPYAEPGKRDPGCRAGAASCNEEAAGETDGARASCHAGRATLGLPRAEAGRRAAGVR